MGTEAENMRQRLRRVSEDRSLSDQTRKEKFAKDKLKSIFESKMRTMMIGFLSKMETFFGSTWGHGLKEEECTDEQLKISDIWEQCRDEILNHGNKQIRSIGQELELYNITWKGYKMLFKKENHD